MGRWQVLLLSLVLAAVAGSVVACVHVPITEAEAKRLGLIAPDDYRTRLVRVGRAEHLPMFRNLEFTPDGEYVVASGAKLYVFKTSDMTLVSETQTSSGYVAVHPSGKYVACGNIHAGIKFHSLPDGGFLHGFQVDLGVIEKPKLFMYDGDRIADMAFSPDGRYLAIVVSPYEEVFLYETETWTLVRLLHTDREGYSPFWPRFSPDGTRLVVSDRISGGLDEDRGKAHVYDVDSGQIMGTLRAPENAMTRCLATTGPAYVGYSSVTALGGGVLLTVWLADRIDDPDRFPAPEFADPAVVSPEGHTFLCIGKNIALWDVETRETYFLAKFPQEARYAAISPDSRYAAVVQGWNYVFLFDIRKDAPPLPIRHADRRIEYPDGRILTEPAVPETPDHETPGNGQEQDQGR